MAVFDGVGGIPGGAEAAQTAAAILQEALAAGLWGQALVDAIALKLTPGATTMVLVRQAGASWDAVTLGDSHVLVDGFDVSRPQGGRGQPLREYLGKATPVAEMFALPEPRHSVLLCSDGLMEQGIEHVQESLQRASTAQHLLDLCHARDDATVVLARPSE